MHPEAFKAEVISLGRITIPKTIRDILDIKDGDIVEVQVRKININSLSPDGAALESPESRPPQAPLEASVTPKEDLF